MNTHSAPLAETPAHGASPGPVDPAARRERHMRMLDRLAGIGMEIAEHIGLHVQKGPRPSDAVLAPMRPCAFHADLSLAFDRVSRAVRMTIALQERLMEEPAKAKDGGSEQKARIGRVIERVAKAEHQDEPTVERLTREAAERLEREDLYDEVMHRPVSEIVEMICRDLGLFPDWTILAKEPWAREEILSGEVGSPLEAFIGGGWEDRRPEASRPPDRRPPACASP